jgi:hypothetical protein
MTDEEELEAPAPPPAKLEPTARFGWCMASWKADPDSHRRCRVSEGKLTCRCVECGDQHGVAPTVFDPPKASTLEILERYRT